MCALDRRPSPKCPCLLGGKLVEGCDLASRTATATGVAITGAVILGTGGLYWLDPTVALAIAVVIAFHAVRLLRSVAERLRAR
jgi:cobalt-zinc-cadmium efflux system protein